MPLFVLSLVAKVTVVDDGMEHTHPDLVGNYDPAASIDINGGDDDPFPNEADPINKHGTRCCGEIGAAKNTVCGVSGMPAHTIRTVLRERVSKL